MWLGYVRVSRVGDRAERLISPELQRDRIEALAGVRGLEVEMLESELDVSGGRVQRPILGEAIERVESGEVQGIVVAQLDRLSRMDMLDALKTIARIEDSGGQVIAVAENFDAGTPEGRMVRNVMLSVAAMQLDRYKAQFRAAKARAVREGIWPFPKVPLGFDKGKDRHLVPVAPELVVPGFELRANGAPWAEVARALDRGYSGAGKIIRNRAYLGEIHLAFGDGTELVNASAHPPLIDRGLWEAAQIAHPRPRRTGAPRALLAGLCRCEGCAGTMTPDIAKGRRIYRCMARTRVGCTERAYVAGSVVEPIVERAVLHHMEGLDYSLAARTEALDEAAAKLEQAEAELAAFQEVERVSDLGTDAFASGMKSRADAVEDARRELAQTRLSATPLPRGGSLRKLWAESGVEDRRQLLRSSLSAVWVGKGKGPGRIRLVDHGGDEIGVPTP